MEKNERIFFFLCCRFHETCDILDQFKEIKSIERETTLTEMTSGTARTAEDSVDGEISDCVDNEDSEKEAGHRDIKPLDTGAGVVNLRDTVAISNIQSGDKDIRDKVIL